MSILTTKAANNFIARSSDRIAMRIMHKEVNGEIRYTDEELQQVVDAWLTNQSHEQEIFSILGDFNVSLERISTRVSLSEIATVVINMFVDDEGIVVTQALLDTPHGRLLGNLLQEEAPVNLYPVLTAKTEENGSRHITLHYLRFGSGESLDAVKT